MKRALTTFALIGALTTPACAMQSKPGSRDAKVIQVLTVMAMAQFMCPNIEPNEAVGDRVSKELGMSDADMANPRLKADFNELLAIHRQNVQAACEAIEIDYGPKGTLVPNLVKPRTTKKPLAGRYPAGSPEAKAAFIIGTTAFVRANCPQFKVDSKIGITAINALGVSRKILMGDALTPDTNLTIQLYEAKPRAEGCELAWKRFGDQGEFLPYMMTRKR